MNNVKKESLDCVCLGYRRDEHFTANNMTLKLVRFEFGLSFRNFNLYS